MMRGKLARELEWRGRPKLVYFTSVGFELKEAERGVQQSRIDRSFVKSDCANHYGYLGVERCSLVARTLIHGHACRNHYF